MTLSVETIESRIKQYEEELLKVVANHTGMMAALGELKQLLSVANGTAQIIAPQEQPVIEEIEKVVDVVDVVIENS